MEWSLEATPTAEVPPADGLTNPMHCKSLIPFRHRSLTCVPPGGGGGGPPIVRPIGVMMMVLAIFAVGAHYSKQVNIAAALLVGILFGALEMNTYVETELSFNNNARLVELGNSLVMFFAGLTCEFQHLITYTRAVCILGTGYAFFATVLFAWIGWGSGLCEGIGSVAFFGFACSLSSRQLMTEYLERELQLKTLHGRLLQGLSLYQDLVAILAFTILYAFQRSMMDLDCYTHAGQADNATNTSTGGNGTAVNCWKRYINLVASGAYCESDTSACACNSRDVPAAPSHGAV